MAGFGAAHRLYTEGTSSVMYEKNSYYGGHTASYVSDGRFVFDDGPHVSFTKVDRIQKLFAQNVVGDYQTIQACVNNYWRGHWIKHPAQCNLHGLPRDLVIDILCEMIDISNRPHGTAKTYADWLLDTYGRTFSETFPMQYGRKYHTTEAANMTTDWLGPRLYVPELREVIAGAMYETTPEVHYVSHFRYPTNGGFVSYLHPFVSQTDLNVDHKLVSVDPKARSVKFANGVETLYSALISSVPLPELVPLIKGVPDNVLQASRRLACTSCVMVNIVVDRADLSEAHWSYFYDDDFFFTRLAFPHMQSPRNVPAGAGSIQAEVYYSRKYRPLDRSPESCIEPVVTDLRRCGLIRDDDTILFSNATVSRYANVIFDLDRPEAVAIVHQYLDEIGILYCGRYGEWGYHWTDQAFMSGENAAQKVLDRHGYRAHSTAVHTVFGRTEGAES